MGFVEDALVPIFFRLGPTLVRCFCRSFRVAVRSRAALSPVEFFKGHRPLPFLRRSSLRRREPFL